MSKRKIYIFRIKQGDHTDNAELHYTLKSGSELVGQAMSQELNQGQDGFFYWATA